MRRITRNCHFRPVWHCHIFLHYLINGKIFGRNVIEYKMCLLILSIVFCLKPLILGRIQRGIINTHTCSCKVPVILNRFKLNLNFIDGFSKNTQISNLMKIRPVGAKLFRANSRFSQFANAPKKALKALYFMT